MGIILLIALRLQDADVRQVTVVVGVVEAVADDEFVGDLEAAHVGLVALRVPRRLVEEGDGRDGRGIRAPKSWRRYCIVRPESMMSSTMTTWRPVMLLSRSLMRRTTPVDLADAP